MELIIFLGLLGSCFQLSVCFGILCAYLVNYAFYFPTAAGGSDMWRFEFLLSALFPLILLIGYCFIPESQGYLAHMVEKKKYRFEFIEFFYVVFFFVFVINLLFTETDLSKKKESGIAHELKEIWLSAISSKKAFIVGAVLASMQQLTGLFCYILYL
jgi:hypothetical protein